MSKLLVTKTLSGSIKELFPDWIIGTIGCLMKILPFYYPKRLFKHIMQNFYC